MKITPIDIAHKSFNKKMMGLDTDEVMDFLQQVAGQMEALIQDRNALKEALREKELSLMEYKERDQVLKDTIATATQMADRLRQDAEREAKLIIADASQKAEIITRDSRDSLKKMYQEVSELKRARMQFEANLKALAQAHLSLLEQGEKYMPQMHLAGHNIVGGTNTAGTNAPRSTNISPLSAE
jgi:cell division initiation protein